MDAKHIRPVAKAIDPEDEEGLLPLGKLCGFTLPPGARVGWFSQLSPGERHALPADKVRGRDGRESKRERERVREKKESERERDGGDVVLWMPPDTLHSPPSPLPDPPPRQLRAADSAAAAMVKSSFVPVTAEQATWATLPFKVRFRALLASLSPTALPHPAPPRPLILFVSP